jgi:hypothetical protein
MKKLVFLLLLVVNFLQAQKISVGFVFAPQITSSNLKDIKQINPLHLMLTYSKDSNQDFNLGYTPMFKNIALNYRYKNYYVVNLINIENQPHFFGLGITFPISKFNPAVLFIEPGILYSFKGENKFPLILSAGVFAPFKKTIYQKKQGSS